MSRHGMLSLAMVFVVLFSGCARTRNLAAPFSDTIQSQAQTDCQPVDCVDSEASAPRESAAEAVMGIVMFPLAVCGAAVLATVMSVAAIGN